MTSLDPTMTIGKQIMEGMLWHFKMPKAEAYKRHLGWRRWASPMRKSG